MKQQEFQVGDILINCTTGHKFKVIKIARVQGLSVQLEKLDGQRNWFYCTDDGKLSESDINPTYVFYDENYDYSKYSVEFPPKRHRWRAEQDSHYYLVNVNGEVRVYMNHYTNIDNALYNVGNCFKSKDIAKSYAKQMKELFNQNL